MDATWEVLFIPQFRRDLEHVPADRAQRWLRKLEFLKEDPYQKNPNAKRLKGKSRLFRLRIGDWRMIYRVVDSARQVLLLRAGPRGSIYEEPPGDALPGKSADNIDNLLNGGGHQGRAVASNASPDTPSSPTSLSALIEDGADAVDSDAISVELAEAALVDRDELYILGVPEEWHSTIAQSATIEELQRLGVPEPIRLRLEDYVTSPSQTHVGKLYALGDQQGLASIASQPLSHFLLALDPQQREIVDKPLDGGPLMVRGGPGTGKTLICVYRLKRIYHERPTESLFSDSDPVFAFVTYNRALTNTNRAVLAKILPDHRGADIRFSTLDQIVYRLADKAWGRRRPSPGREKDLTGLLFTAVLRPMYRDTRAKQSLARLSPAFLLEEIDAVIHGNGVTSLEEYLALQRKGRKVPLQRSQREIVWDVYERFCEELDNKNWTTWERQRLQVLQALENGHVRYRAADALVVDELQDLSVTSIRLLLHLVRDTRFLMLAADGAQSIYNKAPTWSDVNPRLRFHRGNSFVLRRSYRMTKQIAQAIAPLRSDPDEDRRDNVITSAVFTGPAPIWIAEPEGEHARLAAERVLELTEKQRINAGQFGVIVRFEQQLSAIENALERKGFSVNRVNREEPLDLDGEAVHVAKAHSAKGLEFPFVIVPYVTDGVYPFGRALRACADQKEQDELIEQEQKLLYVALSRAARGLWVLADSRRPSRFLEMLDEQDWVVQ